MFIKQKKLKQNHKIVENITYKICKEFNENKIEYVLVGAVPVYLKLFNKLIRFHEDLDFLLNEKDISKIKQIFDKNDLGFAFNDKRFCSGDFITKLNSDGSVIRSAQNHGHPHELLAQSKTSAFHIGFFPYEKIGEDYMVKTYYQDAKTQKPIIHEKKYSEEKWKQEQNETLMLKDQTIPCSNPQTVYDIKKYIFSIDHRKKDKFDIKKWEKSSQLKKK